MAMTGTVLLSLPSMQPAVALAPRAWHRNIMSAGDKFNKNNALSVSELQALAPPPATLALAFAIVAFAIVLQACSPCTLCLVGLC